MKQLSFISVEHISEKCVILKFYFLVIYEKILAVRIEYPISLDRQCSGLTKVFGIVFTQKKTGFALTLTAFFCCNHRTSTSCQMMNLFILAQIFVEDFFRNYKLQMLKILTHFYSGMPYDEIHFLTNLIPTFLLYHPYEEVNFNS